MEEPRLTPQLLLHAYSIGVFPMSESRDDPEIFWVDPVQRGILPLDRFHISRSLTRRILKAEFTISFDTAFLQLVDGCADRAETWINAPIRNLYGQLFDMGHGHSIEVWENGTLVGGVYGVTLGAAFFGESMFSTRTDASKVALSYLVDRLQHSGFALFDTQFLTEHLASLGAIEIPRAEYRKRLKLAVDDSATFDSKTAVTLPHSLIQRNAQTS